MASYKDIRKGNRTGRVRAEWADCIAAALFDGAGCAAFGPGGRGALRRFAYEGGHGIIRKYRRGGVIRHFLAETYLLDNRAERELAITGYLLEKGLPVPMPLGAYWERRGLFYRGSIATHQLDAAGLCDYLGAHPGTSFEVMRHTGECIRRMHDLGVWHADLQVHNILVTPQQQIYLIDFDKAHRQPNLSNTQRARNLLRFKRSLDKNNLPAELFQPLCEGYGIHSLPAWLARAYRIKAKLSDLASLPAEHRSGMTFYLRPGLTADSILEALKDPGGILKTSPKTTTRRIRAIRETPNPGAARGTAGEWVVKESRPSAGLALLKHTLCRKRYRQAWRASIHLERNGIPTPTPIAFIEKGRRGIITGHIFISEFLQDCLNVEQHAAQLALRGDEENIRFFLARLAQAVNQLRDANVYHADLSGKNILTTDGQTFYFIDLDAATLGTPYTPQRRLKNHVQLYDSFCDLFGDEIMASFLQQMLPPAQDITPWVQTVKKAQQKRRARTQTP